MSKSKKNVIDPEFIIKNYGADSVRLFILSDSPPEKDVQWSEQGMVSSYKFIQKFWLLHLQIKNKITNEKSEIFNNEIEKFTNQIISKVTKNLDKFNYNVIVANIYETYNFLISFIKKNKNLKNLKQNYIKIIICFSPLIPHITNECLSDIDFNGEFKWPTYDKEILRDEDVNFVVQINGKKRGLLKIKKDTKEDEVLQNVRGNKNLQKFLNKTKISKIIFVKNRLINILLNEI